MNFSGQEIRLSIFGFLEARNAKYFLCIQFRLYVYKNCNIYVCKLLVLERTPKYRTSNTSNINIPNFEHIEHDSQILRPNIEQARPNIEL